MLYSEDRVSGRHAPGGLINSALTFVAGPEPSFVNGANLTVDGGVDA